MEYAVTLSRASRLPSALPSCTPIPTSISAPVPATAIPTHLAAVARSFRSRMATSSVSAGPAATSVCAAVAVVRVSAVM